MARLGPWVALAQQPATMVAVTSAASNARSNPQPIGHSERINHKARLYRRASLGRSQKLCRFGFRGLTFLRARRHFEAGIGKPPIENDVPLVPRKHRSEYATCLNIH